MANSGRFGNTLPVLLGDSAFQRFMAFADWLYANTDATHRIALERLVAMVAKYLQTLGMDKADAEALLASDYAGPKPKVAETPAPKRQARRLAA